MMGRMMPMVIETKVCKTCSESLRANGFFKMCEAMRNHIAQKHPDLFKLHREQYKKFDEELDALKEKYKERDIRHFFVEGAK